MLLWYVILSENISTKQPNATINLILGRRHCFILIETDIRHKYRNTLLLRDGAFGQINAGPAIDSYNKSKGREMYMAKWSGGCSMTESPNDGGYMHSILHKAFGSPEFKCKTYADPPGMLYATLKAYLRRYLASASFQTLWKCIVAMEPFMDKAFTQSNTLSALSSVGLDGGEINVLTILSKNPEFAKIQSASRAEEIVQLTRSVFSSYWERNGIIHEDVFDQVFGAESDIDTLGDRAGKPLNAMATNR